MKKKILSFFVLFALCLSSNGQNPILDEGDACFEAGRYDCAIEKYEKLFKNKYSQPVYDRLVHTKKCIEFLSKANTFFLQKKYNEAKIAYQEVLDLNPKDTYAKQQLDKCNSNLNSSKAPVSTPTTLTVARANISFKASGGSENISITTNSSSYSINLLPVWCTVQKYSTFFVITCSKNNGSTTRNDYFTVTAGEKSVRIYINQTGVSNTEAISSNKEAITLSVSKEYIYIEKKGGKSESIKVSSNASNYSVSMIPSWCSVQTYNGYFVVTCNSNNNSQNRFDWFYVTAGDKKVKVCISQKGSTSINKSSKNNKSNPTNFYLGFGALKPLIFKTDGQTLSNMDFGYSFTIGLVKTVGIYAKINTNFSSISGDYSPSTLPTIYYGVTDISSNSTFNRFGVVGGLMLKINPIILYVGAGKGHYNHFVKTNLYKYLDDSFVNKLNLTTMSFSGLETDAGLIINFNKVGLSLGVSSFSFKYYEVNAGLGIRF